MSDVRRARSVLATLLVAALSAVLVMTATGTATATGGNGYTYSYAANHQDWQVTPYSGWGYQEFPAACGKPSNGWYFNARARYRIKEAPGKNVYVDWIDVQMSPGKRAEIREVWLRGANGTGQAGIVGGGYVFPAGKKTRHRIDFRNNQNAYVDWRPTHEIASSLTIEFAPSSDTVNGCRNWSFAHGLKKGWL
jgi:hypothetical protein